MKLIRLKLNSPFRSLAAGFELDFLLHSNAKNYFEFHPYCLAGRNGSGKSNVLEALAVIFYHIECIYLENRPIGFEADASNPDGFRAEVCSPDAFELEYYITLGAAEFVEYPEQGLPHALAHIQIVKLQGQRPEIHWLNRRQFENDATSTLLGRGAVKGLLPKYVVGYSSGHNEILSLPFFKMRFIHFDEYRKLLTETQHYGGKPEGRMIYLDDSFIQTILLCHFLFPSPEILRVFRDKIGVTGIRRFRIIIRRHKRLPISEESKKSLSPEDLKNPLKTEVELTSALSGSYGEPDKASLRLIDKLTKCATASHEDEQNNDLYLDYWINDATKLAFQTHFSERVVGSGDASSAASALNLFQSLQALLTLNYYQVSDTTKAELYHSGSLYLNETIPLPASDERIMRFKDFEIIKDGIIDTLYGKALSDGEHQLLHTIGLCLLFRHEQALFLLDEPETHLNPDWRASYISTLRQALEADYTATGVMGEVLLTSHSPFIISDCRKNNVLVFTKDSVTREVTCARPDFETFGTSATLITNEIFDRQETIGDLANGELKKIELLARQAGQDTRAIARQLDQTLGDSIEKTLAIGRILGGSKEP